MGSKSLAPWSILLGILTIPTTVYLLRRHTRTVSQPSGAESQDDQYGPLLKESTSVKSYTTSLATYPSIRRFYRPHAHREKLLEIADLPLLVFIHGLGGCLPQFGPLLASLTNIAPCFGLELPGHGLSPFNPTAYEAYTIEAFTAIWKTAIEEICEQHGHRNVVLIGHSMGCSIAALLATDPNFKLDVAGVVAICPKGSPPTQSQTKQFKRFLSLPDLALDTFRWFDRRGDEDSASVNRFVGEDATIAERKQQLKYNEGFKTPVWKRAATGVLPTYDSSGHRKGGIPGHETWSKIRTPVFLIAGEADKVTKPSEVAEIVASLQGTPTPQTSTSNASHTPPTPAAPTPAQAENISTSSPTPRASVTENRHVHHDLLLKTAILPSPASHALLYTRTTSHVLAGLVEDFLAAHVHNHLSQTWQLQHLTTTGKWEVKNLEKWKRTLSVSGPIPSPSTNNSNKKAETNIFRALKTLREQDDEHTPFVFVRDWHRIIGAVVDISHDTPIYDTKALDAGGISYHKCPSVSKVPPSPREVADFVALIDRLRPQMQQKQPPPDQSEHDTPANGTSNSPENVHTSSAKAIGVHCHYGYNRTGFLICSYLIERCGMDVEEALEEFRRAKPPGIRHEHFVDTLYVRYVKGLQKGRTWKLEG